MSRRTRRVAEQVRAEIARVLLEEASDPRLALVTLTRVDVSPDLSHATVHWSHFGGGEDSEARAVDVERAFERARPFLRSRLAEALPLRRVPELHFRRDTALEKGDRTLAILRELREDEAKRRGDGET